MTAGADDRKPLIEDPAAAEGTEGERLVVFRRVRDEITAQIDTWLREETL